jgi:hypothetical protein
MPLCLAPFTHRYISILPQVGLYPQTHSLRSARIFFSGGGGSYYFHFVHESFEYILYVTPSISTLPPPLQDQKETRNCTFLISQQYCPVGIATDDVPDLGSIPGRVKELAFYATAFSSSSIISCWHRRQSGHSVNLTSHPLDQELWSSTSNPSHTSSWPCA